MCLSVCVCLNTECVFRLCRRRLRPNSCTRQRFPPNHSCITLRVITPARSSQYASQLPTSLAHFSHFTYSIVAVLQPCLVLDSLHPLAALGKGVKAPRLKVLSGPAFVLQRWRDRMILRGWRFRSSPGRSAGVKDEGVPTSSVHTHTQACSLDVELRGVTDGEWHREGLCWGGTTRLTCP